jgi:hypothetical protein
VRKGRGLGEKLTAKRVRELLAGSGHVRDAETSRSMLCDVYRLADGSGLLAFEDGRGVLYYSHETMVARHRANVAKARSGYREPPLFADGEMFPSRIADHIAALPAILGVEAAKLDFTEASLDVVDAALRRLPADRVLSPQVFPSLAAYVGEVIRLAIGGRWEMRRASDGEAWEPEVVDAIGRPCALLKIYKELMEYGRRASMRAFASIAIRNHASGAKP